MPDENAGGSAQDQPQGQESQEPQNPFAGFTSESYSEGESVEPSTASDDGAGQEEGAVDAEGAEEKPAPQDRSEEGDDEGRTGRGRKQSVQERINDLTRARREAERRAEALEAELARLRSGESEPKSKSEPAVKEGQETPSDDKEGESGAPDPAKYEFGELDAQYIADLAKYHADQRFEQRMKELREADEAREAQRRHQEHRQRFETEVVSKGSKKYEDFVEKVVVGAEKNEWALSEDVALMLLDSEVGDEIAYHLASNPEESVRVYQMPPAERARWFGRMEARFSAGGSAATGSPGKTQPVKAPSAPPPVTQPRGAAGKFEASPDTDDFAAFERMAAKHL